MIFITLLITTIGALYSMYWVVPEYTTSTTLMVNSSKGLELSDEELAVDIASLNLSQRLVVTYIEIVRSNAVLGRVSDEMGLGYSYNKMKSMVDVMQVENTEILQITVTDTDPYRAQLIAENISSTFINLISGILQVDNIEIVDPPIYRDSPSNDRGIMTIAISLVVGLMFGLFIAFLLEYNNRNITTESDVEEHLNMSILGVIPEYSREMKRSVKS